MYFRVKMHLRDRKSKNKIGTLMKFIKSGTDILSSVVAFCVKCKKKKKKTQPKKKKAKKKKKKKNPTKMT